MGALSLSGLNNLSRELILNVSNLNPIVYKFCCCYVCFPFLIVVVYFPYYRMLFYKLVEYSKNRKILFKIDW